MTRPREAVHPQTVFFFSSSTSPPQQEPLPTRPRAHCLRDISSNRSSVQPYLSGLDLPQALWLLSPIHPAPPSLSCLHHQSVKALFCHHSRGLSRSRSLNSTCLGLFSLLGNLVKFLRTLASAPSPHFSLTAPPNIKT